MAVVKTLMGASIHLNFYFFLNQGEGLFTSEPNHKRQLNLKMNLSKLAPEGFFPTLSGDFNGDQLPDALYGPDNDKLVIILQEPSFFPVAKRIKFKAAISKHMLISDLNNDNKDDLVFWYNDWDKRGDLLILTNNYSRKS